MRLIERFEEVFEKYPKKERKKFLKIIINKIIKKKKIKIEKEMEEFLKIVQDKLNYTDALIISLPDILDETRKNRIIIGKNWIGMETINGFTCIPIKTEEEESYIKEGSFFREVLVRALKKPTKADLKIIEVYPGIFTSEDVKVYRQMYPNSNK